MGRLMYIESQAIFETMLELMREGNTKPGRP